MKKSDLFAQCCGLILLSIGSVQAALIPVADQGFMSLTPVTQDFVHNSLYTATEETTALLLFNITPNVNNLLHLSITPLTTGWNFVPPNYGSSPFGVGDATDVNHATFLDPNNDGTFELYAGDGSSLNPDVLLTTLNTGFPSVDNQYQVVVGFLSNVFLAPGIRAPANVSFQISGSLAPAAVPVPAAAWLMLSGLMSALGITKARRRKALPA